MTGRPGDRFQANPSEAHASQSKDVPISPMNSWLEQTFASAEVHERTVSFEHPGKSEATWINGVEKALSTDYVAAFGAVTVDFAAIGETLAKRAKSE